MPRCFVALGGNVDAVEEAFEHAVAALASHPRVSIGRTSSVHCTAAVGENAGGPFKNAVVEVETDLPPLALLDLLQALEDRSGREREVRRGPRTLDLDLIFYGSEIIEHPRLRVPHPACWYRRFVLDPLVEIAPESVHPEKQVSVAQLRNRLLKRPLQVLLAGTQRAARTELIARLNQEFSEVEFGELLPQSVGHDREPTFVVWFGSEGGGQEGEIEFDRLPRVPRVDASSIAPDGRAAYLRELLHSALGG